MITQKLIVFLNQENLIMLKISTAHKISIFMTNRSGKGRYKKIVFINVEKLEVSGDIF